MRTNHKRAEMDSHGGERIILEPGQCWICQESIQEGTKLSRQQIRTSLKNLEKLEFLTSEPTNHGTKITILNWGLYQGDGENLTNDLTSDQPTPNQRLTRNKNVKNEKECKNIYTPAFEAFWNLYPKKTGKGDAGKAWKKIKASEIKAIMASVESHVEFWKCSDTKRQYIPNPSTWLNQRRWEDELPGEEKPPDPKPSRFVGDPGPMDLGGLMDD